MRILYVEDNPANLSLMLRIARMGNHEIVSYTQGEEALANFHRDKPDLILLDLQLAGQIGGVEVMNHLRARAVEQPIIAVTAYAMVGDRERCLQAGFSDYMAKPLQVAELVDKIQRYSQALNEQRLVHKVAVEAEPIASVSDLPEIAALPVEPDEPGVSPPSITTLAQPASETAVPPISSAHSQSASETPERSAPPARPNEPAVQSGIVHP